MSVSVPAKTMVDSLFIARFYRAEVIGDHLRTRIDYPVAMNESTPPENTDLTDASLVVVAERPNEPAAEILVAVLADAGIRAIAVGGFTAGFQAEAPGWVQVKTLKRDAAAARQVISEIKPISDDFK